MLLKNLIVLTSDNNKIKKEKEKQLTTMTDYTMKDGSCPWTYLEEMSEMDHNLKEVAELLKQELLASNTALQMVKDENEVNKKNMMKFMKESRERQTIIANEVVIKEKLQIENKDLKQRLKDEIEDNETVLEQVREYLGRFGGDEVDVFDRICDGDEEEEEEEKIIYEDEDDWNWGYGFTIKNGEYRIHIQGGCAEWIDYVINRKGCFVRNQYGDKRVFTFVSCPEGNYVKVWETPHMEGGLTLREGETDMLVMIKECFQEEIMDYETDEEDESDSEEEEEEEEEVVQDINGKNVKTPTEEECQKQFGISKEEFMMLAKNSDCNY